jgi:2-methylcitrate dehydratase PrpD
MTSELGATDTAAKISAYVTSFPEEKLPEKVASFQALRLLDNVGCAIAGWNSIGVAELHGLTPELKNGPVTLPIRGGRMSLRDATFLHSVMARAHDYCDVVSPGYHPGSTDVPVALAMGAAYRRSGAELLCALALGMNVAIRLNNAAQANGVSYRGFDPNVLALFSGTVVAGRLAGLNARQMHSALGFAFMVLEHSRCTATRPRP